MSAGDALLLVLIAASVAVVRWTLRADLDVAPYIGTGDAHDDPGATILSVLIVLVVAALVV